MVSLFLVLAMSPFLASCAAQEVSAKSAFDGDRAYADLEALLKIGERVPGTEGSFKAQAFIKEGLTKAGVEIREYPFEALTPLGMRDMNTIVGVVQGSRDEVIMLSNHYDTKYFPGFEFVGANDGGSTTAWMLEMARALGPKREGATIWLCFFDGEEAFETWSDFDSLYGSRELASTLRKSGELDKVLALINVDMIGDCDLGVFHDPGAPKWLRDTIQRAARELGHGNHFLLRGEAIQDDHLPFRRAGVDAINLIDFSYGGSKAMHGRNWHTVRDTMDKVCAGSLQVIGDVVLHALSAIEAHGNETEED